MSKKLYVAAVDSDASTDQRDAVTHWLQENGHKFWHHIAHVWLILDEMDRLSAGSLRTDIRMMCEPANVVVLQVVPKDWAIYTPTGAGRWIEENVSSKFWP